uniref:Ycf55 n=1 Tax=Chroomonas placoidea TaxID=173977 RepID=A0A222AI29_9CRYP|nr:hypothetical protein [Chroomonas placoidea]ASO76023.1 hypothetical protein [Chroomonas placoidea]
MIISSQNVISLQVIFTQVLLKVNTNLTNVTGEILLVDRLESPIKVYILRSILEEMQSLCINLSYYNSQKTKVTYKVDRFLQLVLIRVYKRLKRDILISPAYFHDQHSEIKWLLTNFELENGELLKLLINSFISVDIHEAEVYDRKKLKTEKLLISILENLVIKFSNIILYILILNAKFPPYILRGVSDPELYSLKLEKNNLYWNSYLASTFFRPKYIYTSLYALKIIGYEGFCTKLVYLPKLRVHEEKQLTTLQFTVVLYFELVDFVFPRVTQVFSIVKAFFIRKLSVYP